MSKEALIPGLGIGNGQICRTFQALQKPHPPANHRSLR